MTLEIERKFKEDTEGNVGPSQWGMKAALPLLYEAFLDLGRTTIATGIVVAVVNQGPA